MLKTIHLGDEFDRIWSKVQAGENFALIRNGDGERGLAEGRAFAAQEGWKSPTKITALGEAVLDSLSINSPRYIVGISCPCCDISGYNWYLDHVGSKNLTFANLWVNTNYQQFIAAFRALKRDAVVIANHRAQGKPIGQLNVLDYYCVSDDCVSFWEQEAEDMLQKIIREHGEKKNLLYVVSAGPMSGPIIARLFRNNPDNCYLDFGSSIDSFYWETMTRPYMDPSAMYARKTCWMYCPEDDYGKKRIPHIIHYGIFGKLSSLEKRCIRSWKKQCPSWELMVWQGSDADAARQAGMRGVYIHGGVYLDTHMELLQPLDRFTQHEAFTGFMDDKLVDTDIFGAEKGFAPLGQWLDADTTDPTRVTSYLQEHGLLMNDFNQNIQGVVLYPKARFCPLHPNGSIPIGTTNTVALHYYTPQCRQSDCRRQWKRQQFQQHKLWQTWEQVRILPQKMVRILIGDSTVEKIKKILKK